ncbi:MAG: hypothetical protein NTX72_04905 [Candidatus Uhrbacteria bacterium]|nr:hypothetical protein [Candidatus Uhrbacteria bacterium]
MAHLAIVMPPNSRIVEIHAGAPKDGEWLINQRGLVIAIDIEVGWETHTLEVPIEGDTIFWGGHLLKASRSRETLEVWIRTQAMKEWGSALRRSQSLVH